MNDGQIRQPPSGPFLRGVALNDVPLWNPVTGQWETGPIPGGGGSTSADVVVMQCAGPSNLFQTDADAGNLVVVTGNEFAIVKAGTGWALTAASGIITYTGALLQPWRITLEASLQGDVLTDSCNFAIDFSGDLVGVSPAYQDSTMFWAPTDGPNNVSTSRVVTLANGSTIRALCSAATCTQVSIPRLILTAIPL